MNNEEKFVMLGENIRRIRKQKNISIKDLSLKTGINRQYLYKIEIGKAYGVCLSHLAKITLLLNCKMSELFDGIK